MASHPSSPSFYDTDAQSDALLAAFQARFHPASSTSHSATTTGVLESASFIASNAIDIHISMLGVRSAAQSLYELLRKTPYDFATWHAHALHPSVEEFGEEGVAAFVFVMDLLNFCFWSDGTGVMRRQDSRDGASEDEKNGDLNVPDGFVIEYHGQMYAGYWSLVAALRRAIEEGIPITTPSWLASGECTLETIEKVFRSAGAEQMPLLRERWEVLQEAGQVLEDEFQGSVIDLVESAELSAVRLINTLVSNFRCFDDSHDYEDRTVRFYKRAQIFVADLWACFEGKGLGRFNDIEEVTMFADYRIPQMLHTLGCLEYSPPLLNHILSKRPILSGHNWEIELRGTSIWTVELLRREIVKLQKQQRSEVSEAEPPLKINAILIDFFLYDFVKAMEKKGQEETPLATNGGGTTELAFEKKELIPHHRTRSIWY